jgi:hypothetical protein
LAIALHSYEGAFKGLPPGVTAMNTGHGPAMWIHLLPFIEQKPLYDRIAAVGFPMDFWLGTTNANVDAIKNAAGGVFITLMTCPSSPMAKEKNPGGTVNPRLQMTDYVPIAGSDLHPSTENVNNNARWSAGGCFVPNTAVRFAAITDGTSNVLVLGEQGYFTFAGATKNDDRAGGVGSGIYMGSKNGRIPNGGTAVCGGGCGTAGNNDGRCYNLTTARYAINTRNRPAGTNGSDRCNTVFNSAHAGGAQFAIGDGKVTFVSENIDLVMFKRMCDKDDGNSVKIP